jgi:hypothetical protein
LGAIAGQNVRKTPRRGVLTGIRAKNIIGKRPAEVLLPPLFDNKAGAFVIGTDVSERFIVLEDASA